MYIDAADHSDIRRLQRQIDDLKGEIGSLKSLLAPEPPMNREGTVEAGSLLPGEVASLPARPDRFCMMTADEGLVWIDLKGPNPRRPMSPCSSRSKVRIVNPPKGILEVFSGGA